MYRDPPRGYRHLPESPTSRPSLAQQRRSRGIFHQKSYEQLKPRTRYWSEGHSNKIHSVTTDPVRPKSLSWQSQESISHHSSVGKADKLQAAVCRSKSVSDTHSLQVAMVEDDLKSRKVSSRSIDNLMQLARNVGFSSRSTVANDKQHKKDALAQKRQKGFTYPVTKGSSSALLCEEPRRSSDSTSMILLDDDRTSGSLGFVEQPTTIVYEGEELEYSLNEHNFTVKIPKGALKKRGTTEIQVGLLVHGPFTFPEQSRNVSPILWLCAIPETKLRKPIQITLPHCMTKGLTGSLKRKTGEENMTLQFASASLKSSHSSRLHKRQFEFMSAEGEESFSETSGILYTKHLIPVCIMASCIKTSSIGREISLHGNYCIVPVTPRARERDWSIHFCVTFNLHSCIQVNSYYRDIHKALCLLPFRA